MLQSTQTFMRKHPNYYKNYYKKNKEQILERSREKIKCDCGQEYTVSNKSKHYKTMKHKLLMKIHELNRT